MTQPCPNTGERSERTCKLCGQSHYPAMQLPIYETCDICGRIIFGYTTGVPNAPHKACVEALDRWIRADNLDYLTARATPWRSNPTTAAHA